MRRDQRGAVTAELALGIPVLVSLTIGLAWLLTVCLAQVRMVDAARETARAGARGDATPAAVARGEQVAPGATVTMTQADGHVVATASQIVGPPGGLLGLLPGVQVRAQAIAMTEAGP
jgi:Flp pilus assembly protein TadG